jgi:hypothetical protein
MRNFVRVLLSATGQSFCGSRSSTTRNVDKVEIEMKRLNDERQYRKALSLFDELHRRREMPRDQAIVQALKACTQTKDHARGIYIHKHLSEKSTSNKFIQSALIHFYSEFRRILLVIH